MLYYHTFISIIEIVIATLPLLIVAFMIIRENSTVLGLRIIEGQCTYEVVNISYDVSLLFILNNKYLKFVYHVITSPIFLFLLVVFIVIIFFPNLLIETIYCSDGREEMVSFFEKVRDKNIYFREQIIGCTDDFKYALSTGNSELIESARVALKETQINVDKGQHMENYLRNKLQSGDYNMDNSTLGKRNRDS